MTKPEEDIKRLKDAALNLAMECLQSTRYQTDADFRIEVDEVLSLTQKGVFSEKEKLQHCIGCEDNFYNGNNPMGISRCWNLDSMRITPRKQVGMNDRPPWDWEAKPRPSCYRQRGCVFINCEKGDRTH